MVAWVTVVDWVGLTRERSRGAAIALEAPTSSESATAAETVEAESVVVRMTIIGFWMRRVNDKKVSGETVIGGLKRGWERVDASRLSAETLDASAKFPPEGPNWPNENALCFAVMLLKQFALLFWPSMLLDFLPLDFLSLAPIGLNLTQLDWTQLDWTSWGHLDGSRFDVAHWLDLSLLSRTAIVIFVLADAPGNAPIVLALTKGMDAAERDRVIDRASFVATAILVSFAIAGQWLLSYFHVSIASLQVAGGLVLLLIALDMLNGALDEPVVDAGRDVAITPLATPLIAGPGTLSTVMLLVTETPGGKLSVILGILVAMLLTWIVIRQSTWIERLIGVEGGVVVTKLIGFILAALAVETGSIGLKSLFF